MSGNDTKTKKKPGINRKIGEYVLPDGVVRLHIALNKWMSEEQEQVLQKYGGVSRGKTFTRDIIVPEEITLRALHYVILRAFGFRDTHLHCYEIPSYSLINLTNDNMGTFLNLTGIIFTGLEDVPSWKAPFKGGSLKKWFRKQYTHPYGTWNDNLTDFYDLSDDEERYVRKEYDPEKEYYRVTPRKDPERIFMVPADKIDSLEGDGKYVKRKGVRLFNDDMLWCEADDPEAMTFEKVKLGDTGVHEGLSTIVEKPCNIIERLPLCCVLAMSGDYLPYDDEGNQTHTVRGLKQPQIFGTDEILNALRKNRRIFPKAFTDSLLYTYDFGDNWEFVITGSHGCSDLIESGILTEGQLMKSLQKLTAKSIPVLIAKDGYMLVDDAGGIGGYTRFLKNIDIAPDMVIKETDYYEYGMEYGSIPHFEDEEYWNSLDDDDDDEDEWDEGEEDVEWFEDESEDVERDENDMSRADLLNWAVSQGWHVNDFEDIDLL